MQQTAEKIWSSAQEHLRSSMNVDTYNMWFAPLRASAIDASHFTLEATNEFCEVWLKDNYLGLLQKAFAAASGRQLQIKFKTVPGNSPIVNVAELVAVKVKFAASAQGRPAHKALLHFNSKNTLEMFLFVLNINVAVAS